MRFAVVDGVRTTAFSKGRGECPSCGEQAPARCGTINIWHWAHVAREDCDSFSEGETE